MTWMRKIARIVTLPILNKEKRKTAREAVEFFLNKLLKTEYYQCYQRFNQMYQQNRQLGFDKYHLISLGYNCFGRMTFNFWGLKPRKADGEKTMPFDISANPIESVAELLKTNFAHYFEDVQYDTSKNYWINNRYNISFVHDHENDKNIFMERYQNRIQALNEAIQDDKPCLFFAYHESDVKAESINALYAVLSEICAHKKFKLVYMIFNHSVPQGINENVAVYRDDYPEGYVHMDKFTKFKRNGLKFELGVVELTRHQIESLIE